MVPETSPGGAERIAGVVLAAGQGTRMQSTDLHKVCFPVAGTPAINRMAGTLREAGIGPVVVVVGALAGKVMDTVTAQYPETLFAYQARPKGTGHAARCGFAPLERTGFDGPVLVTMGDKIVRGRVIDQLRELFYRTKCDAAFAVSRKPGREQGRVAVAENGHVRWLLEATDIQRALLFERLRTALRGRRSVQAQRLRRIAEEAIPRASRRERVLAPIRRLLDRQGAVRAQEVLRALPADGERINTPAGGVTARQAERQGRYVNESVYLIRAPLLGEALAHLSARTAQGEEYLPDVITYALRARDREGRPRYKVRAMVLEDDDDVVGYNTPDELLAVEAVVAAREEGPAAAAPPAARRRLPGGVERTAGEWISLFEADRPALRKALVAIYGQEPALLAERKKAYLRVLRLFARTWGADRPAVIARAPGRVNLMGRHIEHRGGYINTMAINREVLMVAGHRDDDRVRLVNVNRRAFADREFRISEELAAVPWEDWLAYINSRRVQQMVLDAKGDWANYVKAACLRLQSDFRNVRLTGMDAAVLGNIPQAAGLSSSSAIVVAAGEAAITCNHLDMQPTDFVDLCGEGEWYVGSRGGAGDHAAMKFGRRAQVARVRFFPLVCEHMPGIPEDVRLVIFDSQIKAHKSAEARDVFNQKVASYILGLMLVLDRWPQYAHLVEHLRDLDHRRLHVKPHVIYELLLSLPPKLTRAQLRGMLSPARRREAAEVFATHAEPEAYYLRDVVLYGLAECARSERVGDLLSTGDMQGLGRMMAVSHNGDRVARLDPRSGRMVPYDWHTSDETLRGLVADLSSEEIDRVQRAQLCNQPGGYACSAPEIDRMVDLAREVPGVLGAQLSGAGLGGCMMALVRADAVARLRRKLAREFYRPRGQRPDVTVSSPIEGSGLLRV